MLITLGRGGSSCQLSICFFHTLQVVFPAFQVAETKTKICFSPERDGSNTRTVVWDLELADKVLGEVLYETKVAFIVIYD